MKIKKLFVALFAVIMLLVAAESSFAQKDSLRASESLARGESLYSKNKSYRLVLQDDGNLVLYVVKRKNISYKALWNSQTSGRAVEKAVMQKDGNLVLYDYQSKPVWDSRTSNVKNIDSYLLVQDDGNLVIYTPNRAAVWNTRTQARP